MPAPNTSRQVNTNWTLTRLNQNSLYREFFEYCSSAKWFCDPIPYTSKSSFQGCDLLCTSLLCEPLIMALQCSTGVVYLFRRTDQQCSSLLYTKENIELTDYSHDLTKLSIGPDEHWALPWGHYVLRQPKPALSKLYLQSKLERWS